MCPTRNAVVFFWRSFSLVCFSGKFGEIWAKILCTAKDLPAPTLMLGGNGGKWEKTDNASYLPHV